MISITLRHRLYYRRVTVNIIIVVVVVVVVVVEAISVRVVEVGATCGSPRNNGIDARIRPLLFCTMGA